MKFIKVLSELKDNSAKFESIKPEKVRSQFNENILEIKADYSRIIHSLYKDPSLQNQLLARFENFCNFIENFRSEHYGPSIQLRVLILESDSFIETATFYVLSSLINQSRILLAFRSQISEDSVSFIMNLSQRFEESRVAVVDSLKNDELTLLVNHPAVDSVVSFDSEWGLDKLPVYKKQVVWRGHNFNSVIIFKDADLKFAATQIASHCLSSEIPKFEQIHRILVAESVKNQFLECLIEAVAKSPLLSSLEAFQEQSENQLSILLQEQGREVVKHKGSFIVRDLPYCSIYHQEPMSMFGLVVCDFKYNYEAVKWINTGFLDGQCALFSATDQVMESVGSKLRKSTLCHNKLFDSDLLPITRFPPAGMGSFSGINDLLNVKLRPSARS